MGDGKGQFRLGLDIYLMRFLLGLLFVMCGSYVYADSKAKAAFAFALSKPAQPTEWAEYQSLMAKAVQGKGNVLVFVNCERPDLWEHYHGYWRIELKKFPGIETGVVVGKYNPSNNVHDRYDFPSDVSIVTINRTLNPMPHRSVTPYYSYCTPPLSFSSSNICPT